MRHLPMCLALVVAACSDAAAPTRSLAPGNASRDFADAPGTVFNVQLRSENEPNGASTSESKGQAQVKINNDGTMEFLFTINNKSDETYTRAHIHHAPAGVNGPILWDFLEAGNPVPNLTGQPSQLRGVARPRAGANLA